MRAIGIILAGGNNYRMKELSNKRAIAAMPVAGSYRSIDFALSNMSNSHIQKVAVLTPVSYTHLDVYKRQIRLCTKQSFDKLVSRLNCFKAVARDCILYTRVVSVKSNDVVYTHISQLLKRQSAV